jgi:methylenetetrahydrofolate--tRNA-(uracil-5-)-methyltransferase
VRRTITVIGGGLAGSEAAYQLAVRGISVRLVEMRPSPRAPAHLTGLLGELVCSNSMKSQDPETAAGMLKRELESMGSAVLACARATAVAAGGALAVDRVAFAETLTRLVTSRPEIELVREEAAALPSGEVIIATGPLTSSALESALCELVGPDRLAFYDAAAPIVDASAVDRSICFAQSRYDKGGGADYLNCPMDRQQYEAFVEALTRAERVTAKEFESADLFCACQPAEEVARRGIDALRYGAMKPVGLTDPRTGQRPWATVQLRPENRAHTAYNLVGFQTNLTFPEQNRVFRMIPGLESAEFLRHGVMHRNTFVDSPRLLTRDLAVRACPRIRIAGQLSGTEGYLEAAASGLVAALGASSGEERPVGLPAETALGALLSYATDPDTRPYQPMHVNVGLLPPLTPPVQGRRKRYAAFAARAEASMSAWLGSRPDLDIERVRTGLGEVAES